MGVVLEWLNAKKRKKARKLWQFEEPLGDLRPHLTTDL